MCNLGTVFRRSGVSARSIIRSLHTTSRSTDKAHHDDGSCVFALRLGYENVFKVKQVAVDETRHSIELLLGDDDIYIYDTDAVQNPQALIVIADRKTQQNNIAFIESRAA